MEQPIINLAELLTIDTIKGNNIDNIYTRFVRLFYDYFVDETTLENFRQHIKETIIDEKIYIDYAEKQFDNLFLEKKEDKILFGYVGMVMFRFIQTINAMTEQGCLVDIRNGTCNVWIDTRNEIDEIYPEFVKLLIKCWDEIMYFFGCVRDVYEGEQQPLLKLAMSVLYDYFITTIMKNIKTYTSSPSNELNYINLRHVVYLRSPEMI